MKTVSKKLISLLLVVLLLAAAVPFQAFADGTTYTVSITITGATSGSTSITADSENLPGKSAIDSAVLNAISDPAGDTYQITSYKSAAGSNALSDSDTLLSGVTEIIVTVAEKASTPSTTSITLTLNPNGGTVSGTSSWTIEPNDDGTYTVPSMPDGVMQYYTFDGWYTEATGGSQVVIGQKITASAGDTVILYAHYSEILKNVLIKFVKTTESNDKAKLVLEYNVSQGEQLLTWLNNNVSESDIRAGATNNGYNLTGYTLVKSGNTPIWYNYNNSSVAYTQTTETNVATTVLVKFKPNTYTLYFNANGGTVSTTEKEVTYDAAVGTLPTPTKGSGEDADVFVGWFDEDGNQYTSSTIYKVDGDTQLTAKWQSQASVLLRMYNGSTSATPLIIDITGKVIGDNVTRSEVEKIVLNYYSGSNIKLKGLFTEATWAELVAGSITEDNGTANVTIQDDKTTSIYVLIKNGTLGSTTETTASTSNTSSTSSNADSTNPKTGDSSAVYMVSGALLLASAALIVLPQLRKKRGF